MHPLTLAAIPAASAVSSWWSFVAQIDGSAGSGSDLTLTITGIAATTSSGVLGFIVRQIVSKDGSLVNRNVAEAERRLTEALNATTHALNKATANEARLIEIYERRLGQETQ